ncbi:MAG: ABC transporter substrate-binding protein, partial [Clostridium sp.]|nr:ABC transporter substrate-binding protein [Clostridium sp.]
MVGKRKLAMLLCSVMIGTAALTGCGSAGNSGSTGASGKMKNIGVVQLVQHDALDSANKGFVDGLKE